MIRRLVALVVLLGLTAAGLYYWNARPAKLPRLPPLPKSVSAAAGDLRDAAITTAVRAAFALNRTTAPLLIEATTSGGVVRLSGAVPNDPARAAAQRVAEAVPEVVRVVNDLRLGGASSPGSGRSLIESLDDEKLAVQVRLALSLNRNLKGHGLEVKAFRDKLTLSGEVLSSEQKSIALEVARETPGVSGVTDAIRVRGQDTARP